MSLKKLIKNMLPYGYIVSKQKAQESVIKQVSEPEIYNVNGEKMRVFYLKDSVCKHSPYTFSSQNIGVTKSILWDRYNIKLPIHFYTHKDIFDSQDDCSKKFALLIESEAIVPDEYEKILSEAEYMKAFDGIFTHSERLLKKYTNAYFIPGSSVWYGGTTGGGMMDENAFLKKTKNVSLVSSDKAQCELHKYRMKLASWLYDSDIVDVLGTFRGGSYVNIADSLKNYRYSIVIENYVTNCYFTEKLLNCFASMTVPIYLGAKKIDNYFNAEGIIQIHPEMNETEIKEIIDRCSEMDYMSRVAAIQDNYERVKEYLCIEDYIYSHYKDLFEV